MDGVDPPGTGHFAKRPSRFDETNPQSGSPLSSPPLSSSLSPLRWPAHPTALRGPREMRQQHSGGQHCAGRGRAARRGRSPSLPSPARGARHGGGHAWPAVPHPPSLPLQVGPGTAAAKRGRRGSSWRSDARTSSREARIDPEVVAAPGLRALRPPPRSVPLWPPRSARLRRAPRSAPAACSLPRLRHQLRSPSHITI